MAKVVAVLGTVKERASVLREWRLCLFALFRQCGELARPRELWQRDCKCKGLEAQLSL